LPSTRYFPPFPQVVFLASILQVIKMVSTVILYVLTQALLVVGMQQAAVCPISTVTTCFDYSPPTPTVRPDGCVVVTMPPCVGCGCATCSHTRFYTTTLNVFGGIFGIRPSVYTVEEIYQGMSRAPIYPRQTPGSVPVGFTVANDVCNTCGFFAVTRTMTYPIGGHATAAPGRPFKRGEVDLEAEPMSPVITAAAMLEHMS
jgi:hypothetical protein